MSEVKFPYVTVQLSGEDGNAFSIIGRVGSALRKAGASQQDVNQFTDEAMSGDYDNVIRTAARWVNVE